MIPPLRDFFPGRGSGREEQRAPVLRAGSTLKSELYRKHNDRVEENANIHLREPAFPNGVPQWPDWGRPDCSGGIPIHIVIFFSGIHSELAAFFLLNVAVAVVYWVELDHRVA